jgi:thiol-disulfide isomerase/thioredoxin
MAQTPSNMVPLGISAPDIHLPDVASGKIFSLDKVKPEKGLLIMFICNHCPFVKHINSELVRLGKEYIPKGISFLAISSNDAAAYPEDGPQHMKTLALSLGYPFPYLYDETQEVAKVYNAACTPDFYLFNSQKKLVYRGQLDDSRPSNHLPVTGNDIRMALDHIIKNESVTEDQKPSIGCNIKWKK